MGEVVSFQIDAKGSVRGTEIRKESPWGMISRGITEDKMDTLGHAGPGVSDHSVFIIQWVSFLHNQGFKGHLASISDFFLIMSPQLGGMYTMEHKFLTRMRILIAYATHRVSD